MHEIKLEQRYLTEVLSVLFPKIRNTRTSSGGKSIGKSGKKSLEYCFDTLNLNYIDSPFYTNQEESLVHFTSTKVLFSILNDCNFRLYPFATTNDLNEISYLSKKFESIDNPNENFKSKCKFLSFCPESVLGSENELLFWRLYGQNTNGVAIKLKIKNLDYYEQTDNFLGKVNYENQTKLITEFNRKHKNFVEKHDLDEFDISTVINYFSTYYKSSSFKHENEIRLIHYNSLGERSDNYGIDYIKNKIIKFYKFLIIKSKERPYIEIEKIILGPNSGKDKLNALQIAFTHYQRVTPLGYNVEIVLSSLEEHLQ